MLNALGANPMVAALTGLAIILVMLFMFARETYPVEVVAIGGAAAMFLLGLLPFDTHYYTRTRPAWTEDDWLRQAPQIPGQVVLSRMGEFLTPTEFADLLGEYGFTEVVIERQTFGIAHIVGGRIQE